MRIFLDDKREPHDGWVWAKTAREAIKLLEDNQEEVKLISLDHDLNEHGFTGMSVLNWMLESSKTVSYIPPGIIMVHTGSRIHARDMYETALKIKELYSETEIYLKPSDTLWWQNDNHGEINGILFSMSLVKGERSE